MSRPTSTRVTPKKTFVSALLPTRRLWVLWDNWPGSRSCAAGKTSHKKAQNSQRNLLCLLCLFVASSLLSQLHHLPIRNETVALVAPGDLVAGKAGAPDKKSDEIADRIQPAESQGLRIADESPTDCN